MADAKVSKIALNSAVAAEEAAAPKAEANTDVAPNVSERRVEGKREVPAPDGSVIVVEHL